MKRSQFIKTVGLSIASLAFTRFESFANMLSTAGYNVKMLNDNFGIFTERGGTILFYLGKKGVSIVDSQFPDSMANLLKDLADKGKTKFQYLINTHHHGDHTSGNIALKDKVKQVIAHANSATNQKANAVRQKSEDKQLYPTVTYTTTYDKKLGREKLEMHYFGAAHTNGDSVVYFAKSKIAHVGDLVFNRRYPFVDRAGGANIASWVQVLQSIQDKFDDETKFICGHAADGYDVVINKTDIKAFQNFLTELLQLVKTEIAAGKTKEQILKITGIPNVPEWKGDGIIRGLTAAYEELTAK
jgi:cyclase